MAPDKRFATLQALSALAGITLHRLEGDFGRQIYVASKWALCRQFDDLDAASEWLDMVTGKQEAEHGR